MENCSKETSIRLTRPVKNRFDEVKPYSSMSANEFVEVLIDHWEGRRR